MSHKQKSIKTALFLIEIKIGHPEIHSEKQTIQGLKEIVTQIEKMSNFQFDYIINIGLSTEAIEGKN